MPTTVRCPLREAAQSTPEALALLSPSERWTYADLERRVAATAAQMAAVLPPGTAPVGIYLANSPAYLVLLWVLFRLGRPACLFSTRVPAERVASLLAETGCAALITDVDEVHQAADSRVYHSHDVLADDASGASVAAPVLLPTDRPATVVFTSGSTGSPKAALLTVGNHVFNALGSNRNIPLVPGDRWLLALPLYHVGGLGIMVRCFLAGATVVLPWPKEALGHALDAGGITHVSLVATQLLRLMRDETAPALDGLKAMLLGGSAIPASLLDEAVARDLPVHTTYGMTEMASQVTTTPPGASVALLQTSGRVLPYRELRIAEDGEILVRGPALFRGYLDGGQLRSAVDADGWFHTKDLGTLDADGFLHVRGRKDHQFISGGENIQPEAIEHALVQIDGVRRAVVVPVPDDEFGQRPVAFLDAEPFPEEAVLHRRLAALLPRFMIPDAFYPWPEPAGGMKIDRQVFREAALQWRRASRSTGS